MASKPKEWPPPSRSRSSNPAARANSHSYDYEFDVYISYRHGGVVDAWVKRFARDLEVWLETALPRKPAVFVDVTGVTASDQWGSRIAETVQRSRLLVAVLTPSYFTSPYCGREWIAFEKREQQLDVSSPLIFPIILQGDLGLLPKRVAVRQLLRAPQNALLSLSQREDHAHNDFMQRVALFIAHALISVPPCSPSFPLPKAPVLLDDEIELSTGTEPENYRDAESQNVADVLRKHEGRLTSAAHELGMSRSAVYHMLKSPSLDFLDLEERAQTPGSAVAVPQVAHDDGAEEE